MYEIYPNDRMASRSRRQWAISPLDPSEDPNKRDSESSQNQFRKTHFVQHLCFKFAQVNILI
jgi:hypothetical protein